MKNQKKSVDNNTSTNSLQYSSLSSSISTNSVNKLSTSLSHSLLQMIVNDIEIKSETPEVDNNNNKDSKKEIIKKTKAKANTPSNIDQSKGSTNKRLRLNKSQSETIPIATIDIPTSKSVRRPSSESTLDTIKASDITNEFTSGEVGTKSSSEDSKGALNNIFLYLGNDIAPNYSYSGNYDAKGGKQSNAKSKSYNFLSSPTEDYLDNQGIEFPSWTPLDVSLKSESLDEFRKVLSNHKINEETESLIKNKHKVTSKAEIDGEFSEIFAHQSKDNQQNKPNDIDDPKFFDETYRSTINSTSRLYDFHLFEPQLGSISIDEGFGALFKVSSEDWEESTWRQQSIMKHNFLSESINQPIVLAQADRPISPTTRAIEAAKAIDSDIKKAHSSDSSMLDLNLSSNSSEGKPLTTIPVLFNPSSDAFLSSMSIDQYNGLLTNGILTGSTNFSNGLLSGSLLTKPLPSVASPLVTSLNSTKTNDITTSSKSSNGEDTKQMVIDKKDQIVNELSQPLFKSSSYQEPNNNPTNVYNNFLYTNYNEKLANYMSMNGLDADGYSMFNPYITKTIGLNSLTGLTLDSNYNPMSSNNSSSANRGRYRCGRCGQPKVNHNCAFGDALTVANVQIQTVTVDECIINEETMEPLENEKFIVISSSKDINKSIESSSNISNSPQLTGQSSNYLQSTSQDSVQSSNNSIGRNQQIYLQQYCQLLQMQQLQINNQSPDRENDKTNAKIDEAMSPSLLLSLPIWPQQMSTSTTSTDNK